jgi:outer membrane protein assembly factor BamD (BamD/ComL family)
MGGEQIRARKHFHFCIASLMIFILLFGCAWMKGALFPNQSREYLSRGQKLFSKGNYDGAVNEFQKVLSLPSNKPLKDEALFNMGLVYAHFGNPKRDYEKSLNLFMKVLNDYPKSHQVEYAKIWVGVLLESLETTKKVEKLKEVIRNSEKKKEAFKEPTRKEPQETKFEEYGEGKENLIRSQKLLAQGNYEGAVVANQKVLSLPNPRSPKDEALFNLGLIYAHSKNPQKDNEKSLHYFKRLINQYPNSSLAEQAKTWVGILEENEELNYLIQKLKQVDIDIEEMKRKKPP